MENKTQLQKRFTYISSLMEEHKAKLKELEIRLSKIHHKLIASEDWNVLVESLGREKLFSTYNLLGKRVFPKTQFFKHKENGYEAISVCINKFGGEWEVFLYPDGTWELR